MVVALVAAWAVAIALYLAGMEAFALHATSLLIVASIPWLLLTVVVSFLEMRRATKNAKGKEK